MFLLLAEKKSAVTKALERVLTTICPELDLRQEIRGFDLETFRQMPKEAAWAIHAPGLEAYAVLSTLKLAASIAPRSLLIFGPQACSVAQELIIARPQLHPIGQKVPKLTSLLTAASSASVETFATTPVKGNATMHLNAACHDLKSQLLDSLNEKNQPLSRRCRGIAAQLASFISAHRINPAGTDDVDIFFGRFLELLNQEGVAEQEIRNFCLALESADAIVQMVGSFRPDSAGEASLSPAGKSAKAALVSPKIVVSVLVVEDNNSYARELIAQYEAYRHQIEPFEIKFVKHVPEAGETQLKFLNRLLQRICCESQDYKDEPLTRLHAVIMDYAIDLVSEENEKFNGITLAQHIRRWRPGAEVFLLTGKGIYQVVEESRRVFTRPFWKHDALVERDELFLELAATLRDKYHAPFWEALQKFAAMPVATFHAMALAHGRSAKKSPVLADFLDFYKDNYFMAETSATQEPLDSLLHPVGSIKKAQGRAAHAFGAKQTRFVTNGTSTANKIVLQSILQPGDAVLIDRNCHISHHYGLVLSGARPYYLEPHHLDDYGISGGVTLDTIETALKERITAGDIPKAILLTNCTFDGIICQPQEIIKRVRQTFKAHNLPDEAFQKIVFLFDEAWFAYAHFHPRYVQFTGMAAAARLCTEGEEIEKRFYQQNLRVYVTQSIHKTLSAFRQASMIHIWDPILKPGSIADLRFEEAFLTHTSTSPHSGIIASLDVARRQMELEGCALIEEALMLAEEFRNDFTQPRQNQVKADWERVAALFEVLTTEKMQVKPLPKSGDSFNPTDLFLDPTKITLHLKMAKGAFNGAELKKHLLAEHRIQINKNSDNTGLLMVHAGATKSSTVYLKQVLMQLVEEIEERASQELELAPENDFLEDAKDNEAEDKMETSNPIPHFRGFETGRSPGHDIASYFHQVGNGMAHWMALRRIEQEIETETKHGSPNHERFISATFVNPYPPGYPILVPGQIIDASVVKYLRKLGTKEIHGTRPHPTRKDDILILVFKPGFKSETGVTASPPSAPPPAP